MAWTRSPNRIEPGPNRPGAAPPAGPAAPAPSRFREEADSRPRDSLLIEPPRRLWRSVLGGAVLFLAGGFLGVLLTVELLGDEPPPRPGSALSGNEAPAAPASSAAPDQLRRDADRMQANAELAALRQATTAERARLEALADQRAAAEAALAAVQERARAEAEQAPAPVAEMPTPAVATPVPLPAPAPAPPVAPVVAPPAPPPRPPGRSRAEARGDTRGEGRDARAEPRSDGRVQLHYLAGSAAAQQAAEDAAAVLRDAGVEGVELRPTAEVPGNRLVRYHRAEDAGTAARLAGRLGRGWALQDSRGYDPGGAARGLELWLPDR